MTKYQYQPVPKPLGDRIQELMQALQVIRDSLEAVRQGKLHQIIPVYGQLRALLSEKSKGNHPLLLTIARKLSITLEFYCMSGAGDLPDALKKDLVLHLAGFPVTLDQELPNQALVSVEEFLNRPILIYKEKPYLAKEIIAFFANKAGGAHYSPELPKDFGELMSFGLSGQPVLVNALLQMAEVTYRLGVKLLKSQTDFEIHMSLLIPDQRLDEPGYIFDYEYPEAVMRIFCRIEPGMKLSFGVTSIQGITAVVGVKRLIDWSTPHHVNLSLVIREDLFTKLVIVLNGETVGTLDVPHPLFVSNNPFEYNSYQNRSSKDTKAGLDFGLIEMAMFGRYLPLKEQAQMYLYFENQLVREDQRCVYFKKGQYGCAAPGTNDVQMSNAPVMWSVSKLLKKQFPQSKASVGDL